jgi:8-oxo-dGTP pyrophosphatase MutT (NUDIX family)
MASDSAPGPWKPSATVAAVIERDGRFLFVEERTRDGLRINQPAGHLDPGESLLQACVRETLEETAYRFTPMQLLGVYLWRAGHARGANGAIGAEAASGLRCMGARCVDGNIGAEAANGAATYLRFAFTGVLGEAIAGQALDDGIVRTLWLTPDELAARAHLHRSPLVARCVDDYLRGQRYPIDLLFTHPSALEPPR